VHIFSHSAAKLRRDAGESIENEYPRFRSEGGQGAAVLTACAVPVQLEAKPCH